MALVLNGSNNTISGLAVGGLPANSVTAATCNFSPGKILQVVSCTKTDAFTTATEDTWEDITGVDQNGAGSIWCVKITPAATSSKIWISAYFQGMGSTNDQSYGRLARDSTALGVGDAAGNRPRTGGTGYYNNNVSAPVQKFEYLDSPNSTSELVYKAQIYSYSTDTTYINRTGRDTDATGYDARFSCTITAMEVAA
tara:strand:- start:41 stop:631 length:591 start_codon:yes stop_codon:yes gene_type:complete